MQHLGIQTRRRVRQPVILADVVLQDFIQDTLVSDAAPGLVGHAITHVRARSIGPRMPSLDDTPAIMPERMSFTVLYLSM